MSKFTAEEINGRINDLEIDEDVKISLMEDIADSLTPEENEELETMKAEMESLKSKYDDLQNKYKERFLKAVEVEKEDEKTEEKEDEELEEKEVIDIKEI